MQYYIISEKDIPQAKPLMPMATDYRLGHKTADWIMGFNSCRQEFMSKARVIDEEGIAERIFNCWAASDMVEATFPEQKETRMQISRRFAVAICKFVEKG